MASKVMKIPSVELEFDENGGVLVTQDHHDGMGAHWVELHAIHLKALLAHFGDDRLVRRLCSIADRMEALQDNLLELDLEPYEQPCALGRLILDDLDLLLEDLGSPPPERSKSAGNPEETQRASVPNRRVSDQPALPGMQQ